MGLSLLARGLHCERVVFQDIKMVTSQLKCASFNMGGYGRGQQMLTELCSYGYDVIAVQEHWLSEIGYMYTVYQGKATTTTGNRAWMTVQASGLVDLSEEWRCW